MERNCEECVSLNAIPRNERNVFQHVIPSIKHSGLFLFALSDNLISEDWFFAEDELIFMFLFQRPKYLSTEW